MNVLILEDDPMVEYIHRHYLEKLNTFQNIYSANQPKEALELLTQKSIQLILLDVHLREANGLAFLRHIRQEGLDSEVILVTAANDSRHVQDAFRFGIIDYLIKPFQFDRFKQSIETFQLKRSQLDTDLVNQDTIDKLLVAPKTVSKPASSPLIPSVTFELEKGISSDTLKKILDSIHGLKQPFTVQDLTKACDLSHVSIRKYLLHLEQQGILQSDTIYVRIGRPYKIYHLK